MISCHFFIPRMFTNSISHLWPMFPFYTPQEQQKTRGFLVFARDCGALRDLVLFIQFKKCEKHPWRSVNFRKVDIKISFLYYFSFFFGPWLNSIEDPILSIKNIKFEFLLQLVFVSLHYIHLFMA